MFPAQTICHSQFFCTKVFDAFLSWLISFYNCTGGHLTEGIFIPHHPRAIYRHRCPLWPKAPGIKSFQLPSRAELGFAKLAGFLGFFSRKKSKYPWKTSTAEKELFALPGLVVSYQSQIPENSAAPVITLTIFPGFERTSFQWANNIYIIYKLFSHCWL